MSTDVTDLIMIKYHIEEVNRKINTLYEEKDSLVKELERRCFHPTVKIDRNYRSGGYDYVSSVTIVKTCTLCDKVLESYKDPNHKGMHE